jgi:hypothetical protein
MVFLLDDLVFFIGKKIKEMAEEEIYGDKNKIQEILLNLQAKLDMGEIREEEYKIMEKELLEKLNEIHEEKG